MADAAKGFLGSLYRVSASALASSITATAPFTTDNPHLVYEIAGRGAPTAEDVARYPKFLHDQFVLLHGPIEPDAFTTRTSPWVIILHQPGSEKMWSLFRSNNKEEALRVFSSYKGVISLLIKSDISLCEKQTLEKICTKLREPYSAGWTAAHIAAAFDYYKLIKHPLFAPFLNAQEGSLLQTPLHVAIGTNNFNAVKELINSGAQLYIKDLKNNSIVHYAAKALPIILKLVMDSLPPSFSMSFNEVNQNGMTPLSIACKYNIPENVQKLLRFGCDVFVPTKNEGYPITIAVKSDSISSIQELVAHSVDQLNLRDPNDGTCPLHWASGPETMAMLLDLGSDPNIANNAGQTALHIQARKGSLKGALQLLCHHAFPDIKDAEGDTPMHVAARLCSKVILQVLISFDADVNLLNHRGESARHLICTSQRSDKDKILFYLDSVGANRCPPSLQGHCTVGCKYSEVYRGIPPEDFTIVSQPSLVHQALYAFSINREVLARSRRGSTSSDPREEGMDTSRGAAVRRSLLDAHIGGRVLCLDGGGIRGVVLTQVLMYMQKEFGIPIVELFDWISGTSTGGILALCLGSGKSPVEIQALYLRLKDKVFVGSRPYSVESMEEFLKQELGSETKMSNLHRPRLMITTAIADHRPADFHFFRNYLSPSVIVGEQDFCRRSPEEVYVWEAAKATGAAPSYFRLDGRYVDGGLVSNNPTLDVLTELTQFSAVMKATGDTGEIDAKLPSVVVSIGTGVQPLVKANASHYDISRPDGIFDAIGKVPKIANLINLLVEQATQTEGQIVERARAWCSSIGVPYFRFSPPLSTFVDLDETNDEVLVNLMWETRAYLYSHHSSIVELKRHLFANGCQQPID